MFAEDRIDSTPRRSDGELRNRSPPSHQSDETCIDYKIGQERCLLNGILRVMFQFLPACEVSIRLSVCRQAGFRSAEFPLRDSSDYAGEVVNGSLASGPLHALFFDSRNERALRKSSIFGRHRVASPNRSVEPDGLRGYRGQSSPSLISLAVS